MAPITLDCYFTTISPWAYLGMGRLRVIAESAGVPVRYLPLDFPRILASVEVKPLGARPESLRRNRMQELRRWRDYLAMPLNLKPRYFPTDPALSSRMIAIAGDEGLDAGTLSEAFLTACWVDERDIADPDTAQAIATAAGLDGEALLESAQRPAAAARIDAYTDEALARGVIGSPCYLFGEQVFFGQDRLEFVARALGLSP